MSDDVSIRAVEAARRRIAGYVRRTPILARPNVQTDLPPALHLKLENLQVAGSFKARGVFNTLLQLDDPQRQRGVTTASGGNHGLALAYGAQRLGIPATVYLPERASADRAARIASFGARVLRHGQAWDDANAEAQRHAESDGSYYVHPFDALPTLEGQGTMGLELLEELPALDCVVLAVGGGGLIAGAAAAIKQLRPKTAVIGVEPVGAATLYTSLAANAVTPLTALHTIADTLSARSTSERILGLARRYVDQVVLIEDRWMVEGMRWLWRECNQLVEPSGAAAIGALLSGAIRLEAYQCPTAVICGGNASAGCVFDLYASVSYILTTECTE